MNALGEMGPRQARHFAWLLRPDVRKATRSHDGPNDVFEGWWLACGRKEYPAFGALEPEQAAWLRAPVGQLDVGGMGTMRVPRVMQLVLQYRPDVRQSLGKDPLGMAAWFFSSGLAEHQLLDLIDASWVGELDRRATLADDHSSTDVSVPRESAPAPSLLMALMWHLLPKEQRRSQALESTPGRWRFLASFFGGVGRSASLQMLLAPRWRAWLGQMVLASATGSDTTRTRWQAMGLKNSSVAWLNNAPPPWAADRSQGTARAEVRPSTSEETALPPSRDPGHRSASVPLQAVPPHWRTRPFGVNLYGFAYGELGIGEDVRMAALACEACEIPYRVVNVDPGSQLRQADRVLADKVARAGDEAPFAFNIFCMPGFDMVGRVVMRDGPQLLAGHCNIGWWPWELPVWPKRWRPAFDLVDEVWASSAYTQTTYTHATDKPVTLVPLAVSVERMRPLARSALGLPARRFLFLFIFDANSFLPRKNPQAVIEAFVKAFPKTDRGVGLVVKTMNGRPGNPIWDTFRAFCLQDDRVILLEQTLDREDVLGLVNACDAYVSLHRAEGFGRTLAEAMLLGKPVVATDFSGNADFMSAGHAFPVPWSRRPVEPGEYLFVEPDDQAWWAQPDVDAAAHQMRAARASAGDKRFAQAVKRQAEQVFSPHRVGTMMRQRLEQLWGEPQSAPASSPQPQASETHHNPWPGHAQRLMRWEELARRPREAGLVSVIIPVLDNPRCTQACLQALHDQPAGLPFEVVCVDNGSGPVTRRLLAAWQMRWDRMRLLTLETNHQFALGCNLGFQASRGERVVFLNNDTEVQANWLVRLVAPLRDPRVMAVQPKLVFDDGRLQCAGVVFSPEQDLGYPLYAGVSASASWVNGPRDVQAVTGACMAMRATDFVRCRGFDPVFINGHEDVDLCLRLIALPTVKTADGVETHPSDSSESKSPRVCRYEPGSVVVHHEGRTPGRHTHLRMNRQTFLGRWRGRIVADDQTHYEADGFEVVRYMKDNPTNDRLGIAVSRPELRPKRSQGPKATGSSPAKSKTRAGADP